jgi:DNA-binding GntR family transcriptional regulator
MVDELISGMHLDRALLSDQIYAHIKGMIKDRSLEPGEQVVESKLARDLGVSQAPVREAMKRLVHEGLVSHIPHHGNFVSEFSAQEAEDARMARVALEGMAARTTFHRLREQDEARLLALIEDMRHAARRGEIVEFRELDFSFHRAVIEMSGNVYLPRMWDLLEPSLRSLHVLSDPAFDGDWSDVAESHQDLLTALLVGDPDSAAQEFIDHATGLAVQRRRDALTGGSTSGGSVRWR